MQGMVGYTFTSAKVSMDYPRPVKLPTTSSARAATTPGLWLHNWRPVMFCLTIDNCGIEYVGEQHIQHLLDTLKEHYMVTTDWEVNKYVGIDLEWDYKSHTCRLTMENYIRQLLIRYGYPAPRKSQQSPHQHREIIYEASIQKPLEEDHPPP